MHKMLFFFIPTINFKTRVEIRKIVFHPHFELRMIFDERSRKLKTKQVT